MEKMSEGTSSYSKIEVKLKFLTKSLVKGNDVIDLWWRSRGLVMALATEDSATKGETIELMDGQVFSIKEITEMGLE